MKSLRKALLGAAVAATMALTVMPAQANHAWGPYHWARTSNPFTLQVVDSVTSGWDSYLTTANSDWSKSTVLDLTRVQGDEASNSRKRCNPISGKIRVCNQTYGFNGWLGIAQISITSGNHISAGITKLNDSYFNTATYNKPEWRLFVMCQEIGHDFGLDHQDEDFNNANLGSCMDYTNSPGTNQHPNQHDYDMIETIYNHNDSFNSYSTATGSSVTKSRNVNADGETTITWVLWADGHRGVHADDH